MYCLILQRANYSFLVTKVRCDNFHYSGDAIEHAHKDVYLGTVFGKDKSRSQVDRAVSDLYSRCNLLLAQFGKAFSSIKYKLFKSYCMSLHGCVLWDFSLPHVKKFYTAWRKCVRRIFNIPNNTHCRFLNLLCGDLPVESQVYLRFLKFLRQCIFSSNGCLRLCSKLALQGSRSQVSDSINYICSVYNISKFKIANLSTNDLVEIVHDTSKSSTSQNDIVIVNVISDLVSARDQRDFSFLSPAEIQDMLVTLCTE